MKSQNLLTKYKPPKMFSTKKMYRSQRAFNLFLKLEKRVFNTRT